MICERIEQMNDEELVQTFLNLKQDKDLIDRDQNLIKMEFQKRLDTKGIKKLALESGHIALIHKSITRLNTPKVKEFLAERLEEFQKTSESDSVTIMSWDSKEAQMKRFTERK